MSAETQIEWAPGGTWNPVLGCSKISPGCQHCYAVNHVHRMAGSPNAKVATANAGLTHRKGNSSPTWTGVVRVLPERLGWPFDLPKQSTIFVNSLGDLFHEDVPVEFIQRVFGVMRATPWHVYQVLTKRAERLEALSPEIDWPENVWQGVSVENQAYTVRVGHVRRTGAKTKFLSIEPQLSHIELDLTGIDWVITGGESGPNAREFDPAWAVSVREQCAAAGTKFFHKQNGVNVVGSEHKNKKLNGRLLDGHEYNEMPPIPAVAVPSKKERMALKARLAPESLGELAPESQVELIQLGVRSNVSPEPHLNTVEVIVPFDYALLTVSEQSVVDALAVEITDFVRRGAADALRIGKKLLEAKQILGHGRFASWLQAEFNWSADTAQRLMKIAAGFNEIPQRAVISQTALLLLAGDDVPQEARGEAISRAAKGEKITQSIAREIVKGHSLEVAVVVGPTELAPEEDTDLGAEDDEVSDDVAVILAPPATTKTSKQAAGQRASNMPCAALGACMSNKNIPLVLPETPQNGSTASPTTTLVPRTDATPKFECLSGLLRDLVNLLPLWSGTKKFRRWYRGLPRQEQWWLAIEIQEAHQELELCIPFLEFDPDLWTIKD